MQNKPGANKQIKNTKAALFKMHIIGKNSQETFWCYSQRNMKKNPVFSSLLSNFRAKLLFMMGEKCSCHGKI